jgi:hypothetical protein
MGLCSSSSMPSICTLWLHSSMLADVLKYVAVFLVSMFKFVGGPAFGAAYDLNFVGVVSMTVLGLMTSVLVISFFGIRLRAWLQGKMHTKRKKFTKRNRRIVKIWRSYGEFGVAFFTPVLFSPIIGTLLVTTLGGKRKRVIAYMLISSIFWAIALVSLSDVLLDLLFKI